MKYISRLAAGGIALASALSICAQGCPPGQYPVIGQGWNYCAPTPGGEELQQQARPQPTWQNRWQSIAIDAPKGILGTAKDYPDKSAAKNAAMNDCQRKGGTSCEIKITTGNACLTMVIGDKFVKTEGGETKNEAEQKALNACGGDDSNCRVYYSSCSLSVRSQ